MEAGFLNYTVNEGQRMAGSTCGICFLPPWALPRPQLQFAELALSVKVSQIPGPCLLFGVKKFRLQAGYILQPGELNLKEKSPVWAGRQAREAVNHKGGCVSQGGPRGLRLTEM